MTATNDNGFKLDLILEKISEIDSAIDTINTSTTNGDTIPVNAFDISFDRISGYSRNTIYANNTNVDTTERTIGEGVPINGNELTFPASARIISIASTSALDLGVTGDGMRSVYVIGLTSDFTNTNESVILNGQTPVNTVNSYIVVTEMFGNQTGSTNHNVGTIYASDSTDTWVSGVPQSRVYDIMAPTHCLSKTGCFQLHKDTKMGLRRVHLSTTATETKPCIVRIYRTDTTVSTNSEYLFDTIYLAGNDEYILDNNFFYNVADRIRITAQATGGGNVEIAIKLDTVQKDIS